MLLFIPVICCSKFYWYLLSF